MPCQKLVKLSYLVKSQSVVFVIIILVGGVWTGIAYSQDGLFRSAKLQIILTMGIRHGMELSQQDCNSIVQDCNSSGTRGRFANGFKKSKKLMFLKCWMKEVKNKRLSSNSILDRSSQMVPDSIQQKETDVNQDISTSHQESGELISMPISSQQSRIQGDVAFESCSENSEAFFNSLPKRIKNGLEYDGVNLKVMAERLVNSSIYWLSQKHKNM
ncbi:hypothetical protein L2E82_01840 [Cichorium intybus]|uniref:Uncharacterized protein n=1 Tax=Cichorium intybus TaxID=13427 RepID=A0ACB9GZP8_CICIN|nr:hypothetical protein L2E82_01840 [Cichorium intybus]